MRRAVERKAGATIFAYQVRNPERYGVVEFNADGRAINLEEIQCGETAAAVNGRFAMV